MERGFSLYHRMLEKEAIVGIIIDVNNGTFAADIDRHAGTVSNGKPESRKTASGEGLRRWLPACSSKKL